MPAPKDALSEGSLEEFYTLGRLVGRGAFSKVFEGVSKVDRRKVAIKVTDVLVRVVAIV
jgi:serine/threonine protein kinase